MSPLVRLGSAFRARIGTIALGVGASLLASGLQLAGPWIAATALDRDVPAGDVAALGRHAILYLATVVAALGFTWIGRWYLEKAAQDVMAAIKLRLFARLLSFEAAWHDREPSGRLVSRIQGDTDALRVLFSEVILSVPADLALFAGIAVILVADAAPLAPVIGLIAVPYAVLFALFRRVAPPRFQALRAATAEYTGWLAETLRAMPLLGAVDRREWAVERTDARIEGVRRAEFLSAIQPVWYFNSLTLVRTLAMVATLAVGGARLADGSASVGMIVLGIGYLRQLFAPLIRISNQLSTLERARVAAARVVELLDREPAIRDPEDPAVFPSGPLDIAFEGVTFGYEPGRPVVRALDLRVPAGGRVAVVGTTGSGKSTLASLILRFRDVDAGRVSIGGVDVRALRVDELRRRIGFVPQDVVTFPGSVLDNLGGDRERARAAVARLGVDLPLDRDADVRSLSRGERQLLTFARALVDDPPILVLDEATSAVDPATEDQIQRALEALQGGRTTLVIAHRLETVRDCDAIAVVEAGRVVEVGRHEQLLANSGRYSELWRVQAVAS